MAANEASARGRKLARELENFVTRDATDREEAAAVLASAYEYLEERTRLYRNPEANPWPAEPDAKLNERN